MIADTSIELYIECLKFRRAVSFLSVVIAGIEEETAWGYD